MSNNVYNQQFQDFIAIPLTSNPRARAHTVTITNNEMAAGSIPKDSKAKVDKIYNIEQRLIKVNFGQVRQDVFDSIKNELSNLLA